MDTQELWEPWWEWPAKPILADRRANNDTRLSRMLTTSPAERGKRGMLVNANEAGVDFCWLLGGACCFMKHLCSLLRHSESRLMIDLAASAQ